MKMEDQFASSLFRGAALRMSVGTRPKGKRQARYSKGNLPQVVENNGEPSRARTCDPLIKSPFSVVPRSPAHSGTDELAQIMRKK